ncbi:multicopper oxidase [Microtetraspora sp. NBRC 13810]|uniref:multicopper oxidase family protein n=1 Tax=Microtetraspora sp. NBRC 13810 TaxID=3030990 RepID=UPI0024A4C435|nr:multicopper oxidase domain-containing protein [Microtetraspora sp. NBRC 13810]GLW06757.1 multicopper oxidase [Microtetraspora sp. NBRC 13810]
MPESPPLPPPPPAAPARRRLTRRRLLKAGLIGTSATVVATAGTMAWLWTSSDASTAGQVRFVNRLAIPPLDSGRLDGSGRRVFDLRAAAGSRRWLPGRPTATWGFDGGHLGPTLRAARGETVLVNVRNDLAETTTVHWHGMHLPAVMDGGPHQPIAAGGTWHPTWRIDQPAATLWYHPHPHGRTGRHVYLGMAGMFILDDPQAAPPGLPARYGVDDIPVIVQDKNFDGDNQLSESTPLVGGIGILGGTLMVNGTLAPYLDVVAQRTRLRLLNASTSRTYRFGLADGRPFEIVGSDGGLLPAPHTTDRVQLSAGERAEIVVTLRPGERVVLRSFPPDLGTDFWTSRVTGGDDTMDVLELRAAARLEPSPALPGALAEPPALGAADGEPDRRFELAGFEINGRGMDMDRIDFGVVTGRTEVWEISNVDMLPHNFHVHGAQFQVLSVGGAAPPPELRGWKDTVYTPGDAPIRIAVRFGGHTDPDTPYMFHCHLLYHEDLGMMGQFVVTEPGQRPGRPASPRHAGHG